MWCTLEQKLRYTTSLLEKDAWNWWEAVPESQYEPLTLTWTDFQREFIDKYTLPVYWSKKKVEFLELKQKEMTVVEYEVKFTRLSRYAPEEVATDQMKRNRFEGGLRFNIHTRMAVKVPTYQALLKTTLRAEELVEEERRREGKKQKLSGGSSTTRGQKGTESRPSGVQDKTVGM